MGGPTLLRKGALRETGYSEPQSVLDTYVPIDYILNMISERLSRDPTSPLDRILLILATTGAAKSTLLPAYIYYKFYPKLKRDIAITQPRVVTARSIAIEMTETYSKKNLDSWGMQSYEPFILGENVGYKTHSFKVIPARGLIYMTAGTLLQQFNTLSDDEMCDKYAFIIVDEAHSLSADIVTTIEASKKFINRNITNPKCPFVILTTGTFDIKYYTDYMLSGLDGRYLNMIKVQGSSFPRKEVFLNRSSANLINSVVKVALTIHLDERNDYLCKDNVCAKLDEKLVDQTKHFLSKLVTGSSEKERDMLVFMSGGEGDAIQSKFMYLFQRLGLLVKYPIKPLILNAKGVNSKSKDFVEAIEMKTQDIIIRIDGKNIPISRKLIIATNVVETGYTMDTLGYVIDMGWVQNEVFDPNFNVYMMLVSPVTQEMHLQRLGRIGRVAPGTCYTLFTEECYNMMRSQGFPDTITKDITMDLLSTIIREVDSTGLLNKNTLPQIQKSIKFHKPLDILGLDLLFKSPPDMYSYALEKLFTLGAIDRNCMPTITGIIMNKIRMTGPENIKMILSGFSYNVPIIYLINLSCFISEKTSLQPLKTDNGVMPNVMFINKNKYFNKRSKLFYTVGDSYIYSSILLTHITNSENMYTECERLGIPLRSLSKVLKRRDELMSNLASIGINPLSNHRDLISYKSLKEFVANIKQCVYEGFKMNLCKWTNEGYVDRRTGMLLDIKHPLLFNKNEITIFHESNPKIIIYYKLDYKQNFANIEYKIKGTEISIMSGYLPVDMFYD